jgi:hypothetical protein
MMPCLKHDLNDERNTPSCGQYDGGRMELSDDVDDREFVRHSAIVGPCMH